MFCIGSIKKLSQISRELYRSEEHKLRIKSSVSITEIDVEKVIFWGPIMSIKYSKSFKNLSTMGSGRDV